MKELAIAGSFFICAAVLEIENRAELSAGKIR